MPATKHLSSFGVGGDRTHLLSMHSVAPKADATLAVERQHPELQARRRGE